MKSSLTFARCSFSFAVLASFLWVAGATLLRADACCAVAPQSHSAAGEANAAPTRFALVFHADGCPSCKTLQPALAQAQAELAAQPVRFVTFDLTTDETRAAAAAQAESLGLSEVFATHRKKTGFVLVVEGKNGEVLDTVTRSSTASEMVAALTRGL